jgi:hypothetical protein
VENQKPVSLSTLSPYQEGMGSTTKNKGYLKKLNSLRQRGGSRGTFGGPQKEEKNETPSFLNCRLPIRAVLKIKTFITEILHTNIG